MQINSVHFAGKTANPQKIANYIKAGQEELKEIKNLHLQSPTKYKLDHNNITPPKNDQIYWEANKKIGNLRRNLTMRQITFNLSPKEFLSEVKKQSIQRGVGNCGEQSQIALNDLFKNNNIKKATLVNMNITDRIGLPREGVSDHAFVVIGMKRSAYANDPNSWGKHAVVVDPWCEVCAPAKEALGKIKNIFNFNEQSNRIYYDKNFFIDKKATPSINI